MDWVNQIPTGAWGALGTLLTGFWGVVVIAIRQWLKRREIQMKADFDRRAYEDKLVQKRAEWEIKKDEAETEALKTVLQLLTTTLTDISNQMKQQARQAQLGIESGQMTIELLKRQGEDIGRKAVAVHSIIRSEGQQTRDYVKQQTDPITAAIEQLRNEVTAAGLDLKADIDDLLTKVLSASKMKSGDAHTDQHATGEQTTDPSAKKDGDGMASISIPTVTPSQEKASESKE